MLNSWRDIEVIVHYELLDNNQIITANFCCVRLHRLKTALNRKLPCLVIGKIPTFHHDNARPHTA